MNNMTPADWRTLAGRCTAIFGDVIGARIKLARDEIRSEEGLRVAIACATALDRHDIDPLIRRLVHELKGPTREATP